MSEQFSIVVADLAYFATTVAGLFLFLAAIFGGVIDAPGCRPGGRRIVEVGIVAIFSTLIFSVGVASLWDLFVR